MAATVLPAYAGEGEVDSQEIESLIESLPKIPFLGKFHCYKYDGFWCVENHLRAVLSCKKHFRFQDSDILLASFPKCGTTWLKALVYTIVNRKIRSRKQHLDIIEQPDHYVKKIAEFLGCLFSGMEEDEGVVNGIVKMCSFSHLSQLETNKNGRTKSGIGHDTFFRHGVVGDSKNLLSTEMINKIDRIAQDKFSPYGLKI